MPEAVLLALRNKFEITYPFLPLTSVLNGKVIKIPILTACGGTFGAITGMHFFRHKTAKENFQLKFYLIVITQVIALLAYHTLFRQ